MVSKRHIKIPVQVQHSPPQLNKCSTQVDHTSVLSKQLDQGCNLNKRSLGAQFLWFLFSYTVNQNEFICNDAMSFNGLEHCSLSYSFLIFLAYELRRYIKMKMIKEHKSLLLNSSNFFSLFFSVIKSLVQTEVVC